MAGMCGCCFDHASRRETCYHVCDIVADGCILTVQRPGYTVEAFHTMVDVHWPWASPWRTEHRCLAPLTYAQSNTSGNFWLFLHPERPQCNVEALQWSACHSGTGFHAICDTNFSFLCLYFASGWRPLVLYSWVRSTSDELSWRGAV